VEPERGASAVHELARILLRALDAADIERGTTVNAGLMRGGTAVNVVAEEASAELDVRFWTADEARRMDAWIREIRSQDPGCTLKVEGGVDRWAMERSAEGDALVAMVQAAAGSLGRFLEAGSTGGASDGQILAAVGCPVVDGLGIEGAGAHTLEEHVVLADIPFRIALYATLLGLP
jgi:glutamate carboxypeptidase